jgi:hypothetical protein
MMYFVTATQTQPWTCIFQYRSECVNREVWNIENTREITVHTRSPQRQFQLLHFLQVPHN